MTRLRKCHGVSARQTTDVQVEGSTELDVAHFDSKASVQDIIAVFDGLDQGRNRVAGDFSFSTFNMKFDTGRSIIKLCRVSSRYQRRVSTWGLTYFDSIVLENRESSLSYSIDRRVN